MHDGRPFTEQDLLGHWSLIYFGFTNCPDICPEELDKMGAAVEQVDKERKERVQPIFISVDPARDTVEQVKKYIDGRSLPSIDQGRDWLGGAEQRLQTSTLG